MTNTTTLCLHSHRMRTRATLCVHLQPRLFHTERHTTSIAKSLLQQALSLRETPPFCKQHTTTHKKNSTASTNHAGECHQNRNTYSYTSLYSALRPPASTRFTMLYTQHLLHGRTLLQLVLHTQQMESPRNKSIDAFSPRALTAIALRHEPRRQHPS